MRQTPGASTAPTAADRARSRFRLAHLALLAEGLATGVLGGVALAWAIASIRIRAEGTPLLGLALTPLHGGLLILNGALALLACLGRWPTIAFSAVAAGTWATLAVICAEGTARHTPGVLGFDARDTVFYAGLAVYNVAVCLSVVSTVPMMWHGARSRLEITP
ncbi:MAG: hypothetical protein ABWY93_27460 [Mycobacterium sp.]